MRENTPILIRFGPEEMIAVSGHTSANVGYESVGYTGLCRGAIGELSEKYLRGMLEDGRQGFMKLKKPEVYVAIPSSLPGQNPGDAKIYMRDKLAKFGAGEVTVVEAPAAVAIDGIADCTGTVVLWERPYADVGVLTREAGVIPISSRFKRSENVKRRTYRGTSFTAETEEDVCREFEIFLRQDPHSQNPEKIVLVTDSYRLSSMLLGKYGTPIALKNNATETVMSGLTRLSMMKWQYEIS